MSQERRDAHEKWVREAEYITEVVDDFKSEKERNEVRRGKLAGSRYEYEIWLASRNPERWRVFANSYSIKALEASPCYGDTPRECLEKVVALDMASPDAGN